MAAEAVLDTGFLVALLDRDEKAHRACLKAFETLHGDLLTTEPVLTETLYLLQDTRGGGEACLEFFVKGAALLIPTNRQTLSKARELLKRYANVPMDYADATLVALAEEFRLPKILTLDHRGFETYRILGKRRFEILPGPH